MFIWQDAFKIHVPFIDHQHQRLFAILHSLAEASLVIVGPRDPLALTTSEALSPRLSIKRTPSNNGIGDDDFVVSNSPVRAAGEALKGLLEYIIFHFQAEEYLMRAMAFPLFEQHCEIHRVFVQQCLAIEERFQDESLRVDSVVLSRLYQWLIIHIGHSDRSYGDYCISKYGSENQFRTFEDIVKASVENVDASQL